MQQQAIDFTRRESMQSALDHADRVVSQWSITAYSFLRKYAREHEEVFAEDVTEAAREWGLAEPPTARAWGGLYRKAVTEGVLRKTGRTRQRNNGNLAMVYEANRSRA